MNTMERPVYHLKGVVKDGAAATEDFVGPLDLILHLLKKNRIAIRDIPLTGILEQFLAWMASRRALDLEVAGEFIAMASHLMLLKTRMLLSEEDRQAREEMEELIASLEARQRHEGYLRVLTVLPQLEAGLRRGGASFSKKPEAAFVQRMYRYEHKVQDLSKALASWQTRLHKADPPSLEELRSVVCPEPYRVERKAVEVLALLEEGAFCLEDLVSRSASRSEATAAFLALLELCRQGKVRVTGEMENPVIEKILAE